MPAEWQFWHERLERATLTEGLKAFYRDTGEPLVISSEEDLHYDWFGNAYGKISYCSVFRGKNSAAEAGSC